MESSFIIITNIEQLEKVKNENKVIRLCQLITLIQKCQSKDKTLNDHMLDIINKNKYQVINPDINLIIDVCMKFYPKISILLAKKHNLEEKIYSMNITEDKLITLINDLNYDKLIKLAIDKNYIVLLKVLLEDKEDVPNELIIHSINELNYDIFSFLKSKSKSFPFSLAHSTLLDLAEHKDLTNEIGALFIRDIISLYIDRNNEEDDRYEIRGFSIDNINSGKVYKGGFGFVSNLEIDGIEYAVKKSIKGKENSICSDILKEVGIKNYTDKYFIGQNIIGISDNGNMIIMELFDKRLDEVLHLDLYKPLQVNCLRISQLGYNEMERGQYLDDNVIKDDSFLGKLIESVDKNEDNSGLIQNFLVNRRDVTIENINEYIKCYNDSYGYRIGRLFEAKDILEMTFLKCVKEIYKLNCCGFIHNDVKSENIMFNKNGKIKIIDHGLSTMIGLCPNIDLITNHRSTEVIESFDRYIYESEQIGTISILDTEYPISLGRKNYSSDIYSLACTFLSFIKYMYRNKFIKKGNILYYCACNPTNKRVSNSETKKERRNFVRQIRDVDICNEYIHSSFYKLLVEIVSVEKFTNNRHTSKSILKLCENGKLTDNVDKPYCQLYPNKKPISRYPISKNDSLPNDIHVYRKPYFDYKNVFDKILITRFIEYEDTEIKYMQNELEFYDEIVESIKDDVIVINNSFTVDLIDFIVNKGIKYIDEAINAYCFASIVEAEDFDTAHSICMYYCKSVFSFTGNKDFPPKELIKLLKLKPICFNNHISALVIAKRKHGMSFNEARTYRIELYRKLINFVENNRGEFKVKDIFK